MLPVVHLVVLLLLVQVMDHVLLPRVPVVLPVLLLVVLLKQLSLVLKLLLLLLLLMLLLLWVLHVLRQDGQQ
jgi:hypothetical protein